MSGDFGSFETFSCVVCGLKWEAFVPDERELQHLIPTCGECEGTPGFHHLLDTKEEVA